MNLQNNVYPVMDDRGLYKAQPGIYNRNEVTYSDYDCDGESPSEEGETQKLQNLPQAIQPLMFYCMFSICFL